MKPEKIAEYKQRLNISADEGDDETVIHTESNMVIAKGYERVVIGDRGPYIELSNRHILLDGIHIPKDQHWRFEPKWRQKVYYFEFRTIDESYLKVYLQNKPVNYADYREEFWYINPFNTKILVDGTMEMINYPKNT
jgi:hypothetical protein